MIDNIKFYFTHKRFSDDWLDSLQPNIYLKPKYKNQTVAAYTGKLYLDKKDIVDLAGRKRSSLYIKIIVLKNKKEARIEVSNSIRKWYSQNNIAYDFLEDDFHDCIKMIASKLNVDFQTVFSSTVTKVEYGSTIYLREAYRCFYVCIFSHRDIPKKMTISNQTIEFRGEYKSVIFYDKITQEADENNRYSAGTRKQINDKIFSIRYEIKIAKVSGVDFAKRNMKTLFEIYKNWEIIVDSWVSELNKITFLSRMTPEIYKDLEDAQITEMDAYLIYLGIEALEPDILHTLLVDRALPKKRNTLMKKYVSIYEHFKEKIEETSFKAVFYAEVKDRAHKLKQ